MSLCFEVDEVAPVLQQNHHGRSVFLLVCDHYGALIPRMLGDLGVSPSDRERHIAYDIGIAGVASRLSKTLDAHLVAQRYSRLVIDCNRRLEAESSIPSSSDQTAIPGNQKLTPTDRSGRVDALFEPYHRTITETINQRQTTNRPTVLISLHSFTPSYEGDSRPWHIGTLYNRDQRIASMVLEALRRDPKLTVGDNEPYRVEDDVDFTIPVHGEQRGLLHAGIEIRQDLISSDDGQEQWAHRLSNVFKEISLLLFTTQ